MERMRSKGVACHIAGFEKVNWSVEFDFWELFSFTIERKFGEVKSITPNDDAVWWSRNLANPSSQDTKEPQIAIMKASRERLKNDLPIKRSNIFPTPNRFRKQFYF